MSVTAPEVSTTRATAQDARGVLFVHSAPRALCSHIEWAVGDIVGRRLSFAWRPQPVMPSAQRAVIAWDGPAGTGARLTSALRGWEHLRYEVTEEAGTGSDGSRWMHTPDLGIFHAQIDSAGSTVVPEDRIRAAMETAGANAFDLHRELRLALGQSWDDELEVFRVAHEDAPVVWLHRAG